MHVRLLTSMSSATPITPAFLSRSIASRSIERTARKRFERLLPSPLSRLDRDSITSHVDDEMSQSSNINYCFVSTSTREAPPTPLAMTVKSKTFSSGFHTLKILAGSTETRPFAAVRETLFDDLISPVSE